MKKSANATHIIKHFIEYGRWPSDLLIPSLPRTSFVDANSNIPKSLFTFTICVKVHRLRTLFYSRSFSFPSSDDVQPFRSFDTQFSMTRSFGVE